MYKHYIIIGILFILFGSCAKESNRKYCWHLYDMLRNPLDDVCDKTKGDMESLYGNACYERVDEKVECWKVDGIDEILSHTESYINFFYVNKGLNAQKHECVPCEEWKIREKTVYKPDNTGTYSLITQKKLCGDTLKTLFQGRNIIIRESRDSITFIQFSKDGLIWE